MAEEAAGCDCLDSQPTGLSSHRYLGLDRHFAEISILIAPGCGHYWLRYDYEIEAFTASGRYFMGLITPEQATTLTADEAKETLEKLPWYYYGGSYFDGRRGRISGPIRLNP